MKKKDLPSSIFPNKAKTLFGTLSRVLRLLILEDGSKIESIHLSNISIGENIVLGNNEKGCWTISSWSHRTR